MLLPFIRTLILYITIIVAIRLMGKRQVGEMQPSELVVTILVSAVASVPMQDIDIPLSHGVVPILTLIGAEVLISAVSLKSPPFRKFLSGSPVCIIEQGRIVQAGLRSLRLSIDDVLEDLRLRDIHDIRTVKYAQVETNGQLSVILYEGEMPVTAKQMKLEPSSVSPFYILISDGCVYKNNFEKVKKNERWLQAVIQSNGCSSVKQVFLLCVDMEGSIIFAKKEQ